MPILGLLYYSPFIFNRQQSILPGRFQPSTFDAWELNCCVRDGNRWNLSAIVTGSLNRLFVFPLRQDCLSQPFLAASTKILVQVNVFLDLQNFTEETTYKLTRPHLHSLNQALDGLVPVRSIHYCTYTPGLSTLSSSRRLTDLCHERSHLGVGFTLRCFQRLSCPDVATQRYAWRHNWYTIDPSTPVLSY